MNGYAQPAIVFNACPRLALQGGRPQPSSCGAMASGAGCGALGGLLAWGTLISYMNFSLRITLDLSAAQAAQLQALQQAFAQVCNALAPTVQQTRVWNRVALHHLAYRDLRARFPSMGSQMVCNAIYAVSRTSRLVFQHPDSPFSLQRLGDAPLPLMQFAQDCPVYFDRHTLSLKSGLLSLYTLEGRMRFEQALRPEDEALFHAHKLREMVLSGNAQDGYALTLWLQDLAGGAADEAVDGVAQTERRVREGAKLTGPPWLAPSSMPAKRAAPAAEADVQPEASRGVLPDFVKVQPLQ